MGEEEKSMTRGSIFTLFLKGGEKRVFDGLLQGDALGHVILHHLLEQVKQLLVLDALGRHVLLEIQSRRTNHLYVYVLLTDLC